MARSGETGDRVVERCESFTSQGVGPLRGRGRREQVLDECGSLLVRMPMELGSVASVSERLFKGDDSSTKVVPLYSKRIAAMSGAAGRGSAEAGKLLLELRDRVLKLSKTGPRPSASVETSVLRKERTDSFPARDPHVPRSTRHLSTLEVSAAQEGAHCLEARSKRLRSIGDSHVVRHTWKDNARSFRTA